ncbi:MAG: hypothetical protein MZV63_38585 [Marinilabiliales bacterium]|nr:hypothetical protein [Marinilabiliales bacterium]
MLDGIYAARREGPRCQYPQCTPGIDVLIEEHLDLIKGKRVGLITNPSAVGSDMRSSS